MATIHSSRKSPSASKARDGLLGSTPSSTHCSRVCCPSAPALGLDRGVVKNPTGASDQRQAHLGRVLPGFAAGSRRETGRTLNSPFTNPNPPYTSTKPSQIHPRTCPKQALNQPCTRPAVKCKTSALGVKTNKSRKKRKKNTCMPGLKLDPLENEVHEFRRRVGEEAGTPDPCIA